MVGVDSSPQMVQKAREQEGAEFVVEDVRDWAPAEPVDVLVSNATLQWIPGHLDLIPRLAGTVAPGGWFAFAVPGNFAEPSHTLRQDLAAEAPYAEFTASVASPGRPRRPHLPRGARRARLRGGRLGDDVPPRADR